MADLSSKELEELKKNANQTERAVNNLGDSLDSVSSKSNKAAGYIKDANKHIQDMGNSAEKSGKKTADLGKNTENLGKTVKDTGKKAKESEDLFTRMGKAMSKDLSGTAITVAKDISKMGDAMKTGGFDGMMKAAEAGQSLNQVLQLIPGPAGVIVPAVAAAGAGIVAAFRDAHDAAVAADIAGHFGKIKLSASEVEKIAERLTTSDWTVRLKSYVDAKADLQQYETAIQDATAKMEKLEWKVSVGLKLNEREKKEYLEAADSYVRGVSDYLGQQQYTVSLALKAALPEGSESYRILSSFSDTFYAQSQTELDSLGNELAQLINTGMKTGVFDDKAIADIREKMNASLRKVEKARYEVELRNFRVSIQNSGVDKASIEEISKAISEKVKEVKESADEANTEVSVQIQLLYDTLIEKGVSKEQASKIASKLTRDLDYELEKQEVEIEWTGISVVLGNLDRSYGADLEEASSLLGKDVKKLFNKYDNDLGAMYGELRQNFLDGKYTDGLSDGALKSMEDFLLLLSPQMEDMEAILDKWTEAGIEIPESLRQGIFNIDTIAALTGDEEALWSLLGANLSENGAFLDCVAAMYESGETVTEGVASGIFNARGLVYDSQLHCWKAIEEAGDDAAESLVEALNSDTELCNETMVQSLISSYGLIKDSADGQWKQVQDAALENNEQVKTVLSSCGITASDSLIQAIMEKEPQFRGRAVSLLNQLTTVEAEKRPQILAQLMSLGIAVDDSLGKGIYQNLEFVRSESAGMIDVVDKATGKRLTQITPDFVQRLKDLGIAGIDGMDQVTSQGIVGPPSPSSTNKHLWNAAGGEARDSFISGYGTPTVDTYVRVHTQVGAFADGGIVTQHQIAEIAEEAPGEAIIPLNPARRPRAISLWEETGLRLGVDQNAIASLHQTVGFSLYKEKNIGTQIEQPWKIDYRQLGRELADALREKPLEVEKIEVQNKNVLSVELDGEVLGRKTAPTISRILARSF